MGNHIIIEPASKIREIARNTLSGNWKPVTLVLFIYFLLTSGVGLILDQFLPTHIRCSKASTESPLLMIFHTAQTFMIF